MFIFRCSFHCQAFHRTLIFLQRVVRTSPNLLLEYHTLSAVSYCLFNMYLQTRFISGGDLVHPFTWGCAMPRWRTAICHGLCTVIRLSCNKLWRLWGGGDRMLGLQRYLAQRGRQSCLLYASAAIYIERNVLVLISVRGWVYFRATECGQKD